jgi:predicted DNA-binding transcriptional regulator YafY
MVEADLAALAWALRARIPVLDSEDPTVRWVLRAMVAREKIGVVYLGGSDPGRRREISPGFVFELGDDGPVYVSGFCHMRQEERVFRVDRLLPACVLN